MILTCPQCDTRFVVPSTIFMKGGRKLRCSSCKHSWFQEEPLEKKLHSYEGSANNIGHISTRDVSFLGKIKNDFKRGYVLIVSTCVFVVVAYFIYHLLSAPAVMGQGLAFDNISIAREGNVVIISGSIVNAMNEERGVPNIEITQILNNDVRGDTIIHSSGKEVLQSGESIPLLISLDNIDETVKDLAITFQNNKTIQYDHHNYDDQLP